MDRILIHVSDIHFKQHIEENQNQVLDAFFQDLEDQLKGCDVLYVYFILTGDIIGRGEDKDSYDAAFLYLNAKLDALRIGKENRICVPGNHDLSRSLISKGANKATHKGLTTQGMSEKDFNDFIEDKSTVLITKFKNYFDFKSKFAKGGIGENDPSFSFVPISEDISLYCFNSAILSSAGVDNIDDKGKLCIDTRSLQKSISEDHSQCKIGVMHHHHSWLSSWGQMAYKSVIGNNFSLSLMGHTHEQDLSHIVQNQGSHFIENTNPQLYSDKEDALGYSIITIDGGHIHSIKFREWHQKHCKFLSGVSFAGNDQGIVICNTEANNSDVGVDTRGEILANRLKCAMKAYSDYTPSWLNRRLSKTRGSYVNLKSNPEDDIFISDIIRSPRNLCIQSPPQFGLTCLSHYLALRAWKDYSCYWLRIDLDENKLQDIDKLIKTELSLFSINQADVKCITIDSWKEKSEQNIKILKKLLQNFEGVPIIIMQTVEPNQIIRDIPISNDIEYINEVVHLLPLTRSEIRALSSFDYVLEDEDTLVSRITSDLEMLNLHRTPLNCFTLLAATTIERVNIINRTTLIERVLFQIFENEELPTYMSKPDVKICEQVLGRFCESIIRNGSCYFTKEELYGFIRDICTEKIIYIDAEGLFKILYDNNIIVNCSDSFRFKHSFWIYYFAARRMIDNKEFADYIFTNKKYIDFPEIIEFYTGIDRSRDDALKVLCEDIKMSCEKVREKIGISLSMTAYESLKWTPNQKLIDKVKKDFSDDVQQSSLPKEIKDKHADSTYNPAKPFMQDMQSILHDYYVLVLMRDIRASSMALRNSDFSDGKLKNKLLNNITESWEQVSQVIVALSPMLAMDGAAGCGGASFVLQGDFGDNIDDRIKTIILKIPENVIRWFQNDVVSHTLAPLFYSHIESDDNKFRKHLVALLLIHDRPRDWRTKILQYIGGLHKNSYYLCDLFGNLSMEYSYSYATEQEMRDLAYLIKACIAKHETGTPIPGVDSIKKVSDSVLPPQSIVE